MNIPDISSLYDTLKQQKTYVNGHVHFRYAGKTPIRIVFYKEEYYLITTTSDMKGETVSLYIGYLKKPDHLAFNKKNSLLISLEKEGDMHFVFHSLSQPARQHYICGLLLTDFYFIHGVQIPKEQFENKLELKKKINNIE